MNKSFIGLMVGVVAVMIGVFIAGGGKQETGDTPFDGNPREVQATDRVDGPEDAAVTLIEYADFECPACAGFFPILEAAKIEFGDDLRVVFRHFPLTSIHPNANAAHRASEAAANQGMFFEMHDLLYERQASWSAQQSGLSTTQAIDLFASYAEELGLDMEQYNTDVNGDEVFSYITSHQDSGNQLNISSTPTLLLNGEIIDNPNDAAAFFDIIRAEIDAVNGTSSEDAENSAEEATTEGTPAEEETTTP